eukprot:1156818-Pelagomonas_calceolata.AAC.6
MQLLDQGEAALDESCQGGCSLGRRCSCWRPVPGAAMGLVSREPGLEEGRAKALILDAAGCIKMRE